MSAERQIPAPSGAYVKETATAQRQVPGGAFVNETVAAAASNVFNPLTGRGGAAAQPLVPH